jgi:hypothetical protein
MSSFIEFLAENKAWWITPIVLVLGLVAYLLIFNTAPDGAMDDGFVYEMR